MENPGRNGSSSGSGHSSDFRDANVRWSSFPAVSVSNNNGINGELLDLRINHQGQQGRGAVPQPVRNQNQIARYPLEGAGHDHPGNIPALWEPKVNWPELATYDDFGTIVPLEELIDMSLGIPGNLRNGAPTNTFTFPLPYHQLCHLNMLDVVEIVVRFCMLEHGTTVADILPPNLTLKVNDKVLLLSAIFPAELLAGGQPAGAILIRRFTKWMGMNRVTVSWDDPNNARKYAITISLVTVAGPQKLYDCVRAREPLPLDFTKGIIARLTSGRVDVNGEIHCAPRTTHGNLICPIGQMRMNLPCRSRFCEHLQCFDAWKLLTMNQFQLTFVCPICLKPFHFDDLCVDFYFHLIVKNLPKGATNTVIIHSSSRWQPIMEPVVDEVVIS